jgi:predicted GNAT family N-acyltransferase
MTDLLIYRRGELMPPHYHYQVETALRIIFGEDEADDLPPQSDPEQIHILIVNGQKLIAYTGIICTTIEHQGITYKCCGLSGVLTFPAWRRKGYGGQLIATATDLIRKDTSADIGLLWTATHNVHLYAKHGWEVMPDMSTYVGDPAQPTPHNDEARLMLFLSEKGKKGRATFEHGHVYVGVESW